MAIEPRLFFSPFPDSFLIGGLGRFLLEVRGQTAALDHESGDDPVEDRPVIELGVDVAQEVLDRDRGLHVVELEGDIALGRLHDHGHTGLCGPGERGQGQEEGQEGGKDFHHGCISSSGKR